jgi:UDP-hydrolysing UDP-N-acetyl-D-glucosamine 2-epimerase
VRKVCVVLTARPSWAKLEPVCRALKARPDVELQIVACASALLERYGRVVDVVKAQGYDVAEEVYSVIEGETLLTSLKSAGHLSDALGVALLRLRPDMVVVCADRHEVLSAAQAAAYLHIPLSHLQGGEHSGSIDDRARDAITALADCHFPCTELAKFRVYHLTGDARKIWNFGCPSIDVAKAASSGPPVTSEELGGSGAPIDLEQPFVVVLQHSDTRYADDSYQEMVATLDGLRGLRTIVFWPGQDAGAAGASKAIRERMGAFHTVRNLPPDRFLKLLSQSACLVGNSSAGIREASYLGVPVVNVGVRQWGRERAPNVMDGPHEAEWIRLAVAHQIAHGRYPSSCLYGTGNAGPRIAEVLASVNLSHHSSPVRIEGHPR